MTFFYADLRNVASSLKHGITPADPQGNLEVLDIDARVVAADREEMDERNLLNVTDTEDHVCKIRWSGADKSMGPVTLEIGFHESELEQSFIFTRSGGDYTRLADLSERLKKVELQITGEVEIQLSSDELDWWEEIEKQNLGLPRPDFAEIDSASMASGGFNDGLADREFMYEVLAELATFKKP